MKITFDLPEWDNAWVDTRFSTEDPVVVRRCYLCDTDVAGPMVRFNRSWWHAGCLARAFAPKVVQNSLLAAWLMVAADVARYPSKHSASEIRAVIQNLIAGPMMNALWQAGKEEGNAGNTREAHVPEDSQHAQLHGGEPGGGAGVDASGRQGVATGAG